MTIYTTSCSYPESQGEALLIQVQDINNVNLGQTKIPVSLLASEAQVSIA